MSEQQEKIDAPTQAEQECKDPDDEFDMVSSDEETKLKDELTSEDLITLLEKIDKGRTIDIEWTTPGRRPPTPATKFDSQNDDDNIKENMPEEKSDFDFQDEMSSLKISAKAIRPAGSEVGPRGSAKKKTVSLDAILSNMARHRKLDMMEDDDDDPLP